MRARIGQSAVWVFKGFLAAFCGAILVSACSSPQETGTCSSQDSKDLITKIVSDQIQAKIKYLAYRGIPQSLLDTAASSIRLELAEIRTTGGDKNLGGLMCEANIVADLDPDEVATASLPVTDFDPKRSIIGYNNFSADAFDGKTLKAPISYSVQMTDDGKSLHGEISDIGEHFINDVGNLTVQAAINAQNAKGVPAQGASSSSADAQADSGGQPPASQPDAQTTNAAAPESAGNGGSAAAQPMAPTPPSFDCSRAASAAEKMICSDSGLSALDAELSKQYKAVMEDSSDKASLKKEQLDWVKSKRNVCTTVDCMKAAYQSRIDDLSAAAQYLSKPAQFK